VHDREVSWSPDGQYIAYISDKSGEDEIYITKQDGSADPMQVTKNADTYKFNMAWSPDSKKILWSDKMLRLQYVNIDTKDVKIVDQSKNWEYRDFGWSPDSKWIVFTRPDRRTTAMIYLHELSTGKNTPVTDEWYDSGNGTFSSDGKYLFFVSNRDFNPTYSQTEWNHSYSDMSKVYFLTLAKATPNPFAPENDEVTIKKEESAGSGEKSDNKEGKKDGKKDEKKEGEGKKEVTVNIDLDGIMDRIIVLPMDASNYFGITAVGDNVYYVKGGRGGRPSLMIFNLKDKKESSLGDYGNYEISADNKKMMVGERGKYAVIDLPKGGKIDVKDWADLSNMKLMVNLSEEWKQIYCESWRQMKYFLYAPNMQGADWPAVKKKYEVLLPYVKNRNDLNYIIGEMIGEISIGHSYVGAGDKPEPKRIKMGLLGAKISRDGSGYYKIDKILKGENWTKGGRSPLTELGVDAKEGDFIIAINGKSTKEMNDIYEAFVNKADQQVELTLNSTASETGSRKTIVVPTDNEADLYYFNWVQGNIKK
ncbi:MAG: PDZ domain-containing protein, partial [Bacteroidota bacterium]